MERMGNFENMIDKAGRKMKKVQAVCVQIHEYTCNFVIYKVE